MSRGLNRGAVGILLVTIALGAAGCGEEEAPDDPSAGGELPDGRTFLSTSVTEGGAPRPLADGTPIRLDFDGDDLIVDTGCNELWFGPARRDGNRLITDTTFTTQVGCSPDREDQDEWVTRFLTSEPTLELDGDALRLTSKDVTIELLDIEVATPDQPLVGTRWRINTVIHDEGVNSYNEDAEAYLIFGDDGVVTGRTACNSLGGRYEVDGSKLSVSELITTHAGCDGYAAEIETALYDVLNGYSTIDIETSQLTLLAANNNGVSFRTV